MMLAVQRFKEVVIYGFHVSTTHGALYHYYDVCDVPANVLRDDTEWLAVKALVLCLIWAATQELHQPFWIMQKLPQELIN